MKTDRSAPNAASERKGGADRLARELRRLLFAWAALIALMLSSLGSAYLSLGVGNLVAGLAIALVKIAIVVWLFMRLGRASATLRIAAAIGLAAWLLLAGLSGVDYATRAHEPAAVQRPGQLVPLQTDRR
ncbi:MAG: Caa(3)-type oxidase subunit IV [Pseudomonadota bacterium]|nr:Caa(3)-type oxidase subunit IV [Pseudomonadota bacterium]